MCMYCPKPHEGIEDLGTLKIRLSTYSKVKKTYRLGHKCCFRVQVLHEFIKHMLH